MREVIITLDDREVFAERVSVSQSEFFNAGQQDLKPEYCFKVVNGEYNGEDRLTYEGTVYAIYRTYEKGDKIELYTALKAGIR
jgi:SPP1 family predicted phage head-tail adaptor